MILLFQLSLMNASRKPRASGDDPNHLPPTLYLGG